MNPYALPRGAAARARSRRTSGTRDTSEMGGKGGMGETHPVPTRAAMPWALLSMLPLVLAGCAGMGAATPGAGAGDARLLRAPRAATTVTTSAATAPADARRVMPAVAAPPAPGAATDPTCAAAPATGQALLLGRWSVQFAGRADAGLMAFEPHPEFPDAVRGSVRYGDASAQLAGDVFEGVFAVDASADGKNLTALWEGQVAPDSCGRRIEGTWTDSATETRRAFVLRKLP